MASIVILPDAEPLDSLPVHRFSVANYHRMIEAGVFADDDRVELLEGYIVSKMPHNPAHDGIISILLRRLWTRLPDDWIVRVQSAITLANSETEPNLAVVRGPERRYLATHPTPKDIALVVEVADSSLAQDRTIKARLYARARIPEYWIVNLPEARVEVYTRPKAGRDPVFRERSDCDPEASLRLSVASVEVEPLHVRELLTG